MAAGSCCGPGCAVSGLVVSTSELSCFSVWVRFLEASAKAFVSNFGFLAGGSPLGSEADTEAAVAEEEEAGAGALVRELGPEDLRLKASAVGCWGWLAEAELRLRRICVCCCAGRAATGGGAA